LTMNKYLTEIDQQLKEGIQLRSNTFQLIRAAFDDEVTMEQVDDFRRSIQRVQFPEHIFQLFAFRGVHSYIQEPLGGKGKEKNAKYSTSAIRGFATKTLKNVTKVTGIQSKKRKTSKYFLPNIMPTQGRLSIAEMTNHDGRTIREEDEGSDMGELATHIHHPVQSGPTNTKTLERVMERSYFRDWIRLNLIPSNYTVSTSSSKSQSTSGETFRVSTVNFRYQVAMSYPALLLVPSKISDESLRRYARCHRHSRFPTITWRHSKNNSLLLRGSGFHGRGVISMLRRHHNDPGQGPAPTGQQELASSVEAERYTNAVIHATPKSSERPNSAWNMSGSELSINSLMLTGGGGAASGEFSSGHNYPTLTPNMGRKLNPITKAYDTLTRSAAAPKFSRLSLSNMKGNRTLGGSHTSLASSSNRASTRYSDADGLSIGGAAGAVSGSGITNVLKRASLYIFGDKSQIKGGKLESHPKTEFVPFDYPGPGRIRGSFKKLMWACVPSSDVTSTKPDQTFLKQIEGSEWLSFLQTLMQISGAIVDIMDIQGASVMICLEDGWDVTAQVCSIAMLCLDPYYRTTEGFRVLIEKEWLAFGHRFMTRNNLQNRNNDHGFTPLFLQFLDVVHQIHFQFPMAFEFNQYYLKFLAYHHVSCRFRTFLLDNEFQMKEFGFLTEEERHSSIPKSQQYPQRSGSSAATDSHSSDDDVYPGPDGPSGRSASNGNANTLKNNIGLNVFDYIDVHSARSPVFHNFMYSRDLSSQVLRPFSHISDLKIWDYYFSESLKHGAPYDVELYLRDLQQEEEFNSSDTASTAASSVVNARATLTNGYDFVDRIATDSCTSLFAEVGRLEVELGHAPNKWRNLYGQMQLPPPIPPRDYTNPVLLTTPLITARNHSRMLHKRSTIELILNGRGAGGVASAGVGAGNAINDGSGSSFAQSHRFEKYNYPTTTVCDVCNSMLWGPVTPGIKCADCGYNCHRECRENVTKLCSVRKSVGAGGVSAFPRDSTTENFEQLEHDHSNNSDHYHAHYDNRPAIAPGLDDEEEDFYQHFSPGENENSQILIQDYLYKQANFKIKGWKPRWFILDATKHQLRYSDTREDYRDRGYIDLSEVTKICKVSDGASAGAGAPKNSEGCVFELQTVRRTYCFCAKNRQLAQEWTTKIQSCLRE
jgi:myotubularin-related protein 5/13